jgi:hypothetical protein
MNEIEKNIMPLYVVPNASSDKRYSLETGKHCCLISALYERMKHVVYQWSLNCHFHICLNVFQYKHSFGRAYRVSQREGTKLQESVPYVKIYRYNPKHLYPNLYLFSVHVVTYILLLHQRMHINWKHSHYLHSNHNVKSMWRVLHQ